MNNLSPEEAAKEHAKKRWPNEANSQCERMRGYAENDFIAGYKAGQASHPKPEQGMKSSQIKSK